METQHTPVAVFYSCSDSPTDAPLLEQLERHLSSLQREGLITTWHKRQIVAGSVRQAELDRHLNTAALILLLVSSDFLASDYCYGTEMQRALQRHAAKEAHVIPILLRPCAWQNAPFANLEMLPTGAKPITQWRDRDAAWTDVVMRIRQALGGKPETTVQGASGRLMREKAGMQIVKALFLAANPASTNRLAIDEEMRAIEQKIRTSEYRDVLVFQSNWAVRPDDLLQLLNQHRPQIVHFSGHGSQTGLCLAGNDGQQIRLVTTQALAALFKTLKDNIRLVFLNACYSQEQALALVTTIDCVIGMKESIRDEAAAIFASSFYRAIGFGRSIQEAFDQGRTALLLEGIPEEDIPELLVKDGIDPRQIVLIESAANPL
ncbi:MAG TPA: CHAT domain-containing protein [Ktedonobacteraceae bacterium]|nr:CHAT domain-containing protein [Ktedonobacteraceae bacterium]